jgi:anti-anti-sigma regulatory factor
VLRVSQRHPTAQRLGLLFCVFWSFVFGAAAGAWMALHHANVALVPPVLFVMWIILMDFWKPIAGVKELDLLSDPELRAHGIVKALLPPELGLYRLTHHRNDRAHQPPDFHQWMQKLPDHWRVIILAVSPLTYFNENSVLALRDVVEKLKAQDRELIISGITPTQYKTLVRGGLLEASDAENLCPDLEFAIARGIDLLRHPVHALSSTAAA